MHTYYIHVLAIDVLTDMCTSLHVTLQFKFNLTGLLTIINLCHMMQTEILGLVIQ